MNITNELMLVIGLSALAIISPGADFAIVTKNALQYSKKTGYMTALGIASATWIHSFYCITGIALIIANTPSVFNFIKYCGATYLLYLGIKPFISSNQIARQDEKIKENNPGLGLRQGFLSNATNPKTTLFYLSLFTMVISPTTPVMTQVGYGFIIFLLHLIWFVFLCYIINHPFINKKIDKIAVLVSKLIGAALILIATKIFINTIIH